MRRSQLHTEAGLRWADDADWLGAWLCREMLRPILASCIALGGLDIERDVRPILAAAGVKKPLAKTR